MHVHVLTSFYKLLHDTRINKVIVIIVIIIIIVVVVVVVVIIIIIIIIIIMLGPLVGRWRSQGVASIMRIDDGIARCSSKQQASEASHSIQSAV